MSSINCEHCGRLFDPEEVEFFSIHTLANEFATYDASCAPEVLTKEEFERFKQGIDHFDRWRLPESLR